MSIAAFAVAEPAIAQSNATATTSKAPPKRRSTPTADSTAVPEAR